ETDLRDPRPSQGALWLLSGRGRRHDLCPRVGPRKARDLSRRRARARGWRFGKDRREPHESCRAGDGESTQGFGPIQSLEQGPPGEARRCTENAPLKVCPASLESEL